MNVLILIAEEDEAVLTRPARLSPLAKGERPQVDVVLDVIAIDVELRPELVAESQHIVVPEIDAELLVLAHLGS